MRTASLICSLAGNVMVIVGFILLRSVLKGARKRFPEEATEENESLLGAYKRLDTRLFKRLRSSIILGIAGAVLSAAGGIASVLLRFPA